MKTRITKNLITSVIGTIFLLLAVYLGVLFFAIQGKSDATSITLVVSIASLGYSFLMAKDTLIEGITLGLIKPKQNETTVI